MADPIVCHFCGQTDAEVLRMVVSCRGGVICAECAEVAHNAMESRRIAAEACSYLEETLILLHQLHSAEASLH